MDQARAKALTVAQVARTFGVTARTVQRWSDEVLIPSFRTLGGHRRFDEHAVRRALADADHYGGLATMPRDYESLSARR